jgi:hypothetical protein
MTELSDLRSRIVVLVDALAAERAYASNNSGDNSAWRKESFAKISAEDDRGIRKAMARHSATVAARREARERAIRQGKEAEV